MQPECAPVLVIGFNRPDFMQAQIAAVRAARPARLYVAVDGPREGRPDEVARCAGVRECVKLVDWPCEVKTLFREKNLGCKLAPAQAIDWFFSQEESGIILEDDTHPTPGFFRFVSEMLKRYRNEEHVGMVSGFNFFDLQSDRTRSYHFSRIAMMSGGWATWRRVWRLYDIEMRAYLPQLDEITRRTPMTAYFRRVFRQEARRAHERNDAWDYQFTLMMFATGKLGVVPRVQLITNVGIDVNEATHTGGYNYYAPRWSVVGTMDNPIIHPEAIVCDEWADRRREQMEGAVFPRGLTWLGCKFPRLCPLLSMIGRVVEQALPIVFRYP